MLVVGQEGTTQCESGNPADPPKFQVVTPNLIASDKATGSKVGEIALPHNATAAPMTYMLWAALSVFCPPLRVPIHAAASGSASGVAGFQNRVAAIAVAFPSLAVLVSAFRWATVNKLLWPTLLNQR